MEHKILTLTPHKPLAPNQPIQISSKGTIYQRCHHLKINQIKGFEGGGDRRVVERSAFITLSTTVNTTWVNPGR
jgi:hypothetical protein